MVTANFDSDAVELSSPDGGSALDDNIDQVLREIVRIVNDGENTGPSVVLAVQGTLVTGEIMPNWLWMQAQGDTMHQAYLDKIGAGGGDRVGWASLFDALAVAQKPNLDEEAVRRTGFIHLSNAKIYSGGGFNIPGNDVHWRGKLNEVDGWMLGRAV